MNTLVRIFLFTKRLYLAMLPELTFSPPESCWLTESQVQALKLSLLFGEKKYFEI